MVRRVVTPKEILSNVFSGFSQNEYQDTQTMIPVGRYSLKMKCPRRRWNT